MNTNHASTVHVAAFPCGSGGASSALAAKARRAGAALLAFAAAVLLACACAAPAHAASKADVIAKIEGIGLPSHLMGIGYGVANSVSFDEATGDAIMADIDRAIALVNGRSVYDLGYADSVALIELCADSLARVGVSTAYEFDPAGGANITLAKDGAVIAKFNTRDTGVVSTGGAASPWAVLAAAAFALTLAGAGACAWHAARRRTPHAA